VCCLHRCYCLLPYTMAMLLLTPSSCSACTQLLTVLCSDGPRHVGSHWPWSAVLPSGLACFCLWFTPCGHWYRVGDVAVHMLIAADHWWFPFIASDQWLWITLPLIRVDSYTRIISLFLTCTNGCVCWCSSCLTITIRVDTPTPCIGNSLRSCSGCRCW
jgi:hypothetical protein